jgi:hypothetical protein
MRKDVRNVRCSGAATPVAHRQVWAVESRKLGGGRLAACGVCNKSEMICGEGIQWHVM